MTKGVLAFLAAMFLAASAYAQSTPGFVNGQVITATQLNAAFAAKTDYPAPVSCIFTPCPPTIPIPVIDNSVLSTDGSGNVLFQTTLPSGLTYPSPIFSGSGAGGILAGNFSVQTTGTGSFSAFTLGTHVLTLGSSTAIPALTGSNDLLYDSASGTIGKVPTANNAMLATNNSGVPGYITTVNNGILATNNSGTPAFGQVIPDAVTNGTSDKVTATGTVVPLANKIVVWAPTSPSANVTFQLAATPVDNQCQTFVNASQQSTYGLLISGNGNTIGPNGATSSGFYGNGSATYCYSSAAGYWSQI